MKLSTSSSVEDTTKAPLALHIRSLRQWHGEHGLSQADLAHIAGITSRLLHSYENTRALPRSVTSLLALALTFEVPLEELIAPALRDELQTAIEHRRVALHLRTADRTRLRCRRLV